MESIVDGLKTGGNMEEEMLEQTNKTENVDTQTTEEIEEGIELTDTAETEESVEEKEEVKKSLKELLRENPEYQEEFNGMLKSRLDRKDREHQREISKYKDTENVLKTTIGGEDINEINTNLRNAYKSQGVELPEVIKPGLSSNELRTLGQADAQEFIDDGYDAMLEEANRLANKGYKNLNDREKAEFEILGDKLNQERDRTEILKLGAKEDILSDKEFNDFRKKFNSNVSMKEVYTLYKQLQPKKKVETPGSMKNTNTENNSVKDFYTYEEASKFTTTDLDRNPQLVKAIENSMTKW